MAPADTLRLRSAASRSSRALDGAEPSMAMFPIDEGRIGELQWRTNVNH